MQANIQIYLPLRLENIKKLIMANVINLKIKISEYVLIFNFKKLYFYVYL